MRAIPTGLILAAVALATPALADPCKAIPDKGPAPAWLRPGATVSGPVVHVGDGDSLCVAAGRGPDRWVEIRLADFYAPELRAPGGAQAKATLQRLTAGRTLTCKVDHQTWDRVAAVCKLDGRSLGDRMRAAGVAEGGNGR
jgi:endonuclease YncB( thermonuclease family)